MVIQLCKVLSGGRHTCFLLRNDSELLGLLRQLRGRTCQLLELDPLLVFQVPRVGLSKVLLALGPLDVSLHQVHHLFEFFILFGEGFHLLYQLVPLLGSPSYPLQMHNYNDEL